MTFPIYVAEATGVSARVALRAAALANFRKSHQLVGSAGLFLCVRIGKGYQRQQANAQMTMSQTGRNEPTALG